MNLKDCKLKDYSLDIFKAFAKLVGERLGIINSKDYKRNVDESCKNIGKALETFRKSIPTNENERFEWQSSVHKEDGQYALGVYNAYFDQVFMKSLKTFIGMYEDACVGLVMPSKKPKSRNIFKRIFSKDKKPPEITPGERDYILSMLLELKREAHALACDFFDEICAHAEFKYLSIHMPQRFKDGDTEWDKGEMKIGNETYKLPTEDSRFKRAQANRNAIIDRKNDCYYLRDDSEKLWKIGKDGKIISVVSQGSFGDPLQTVINRYGDFFGF